MYPVFKDKIALWGKIQKNYLVKHHQISDERIILSGSPRHDMFFKNQPISYANKKTNILITLGMLDEQNAIYSYLEYLESGSSFLGGFIFKMLYMKV